MNSIIALGSIAMDLRRAALGYQRGSIKMAQRFVLEATKRKQEIDTTTLKPYIVVLLDKFETVDLQQDPGLMAEDFLTYSILFQNAVTSSE